MPNTCCRFPLLSAFLIASSTVCRLTVESCFFGHEYMYCCGGGTQNMYTRVYIYIYIYIYIYSNTYVIDIPHVCYCSATVLLWCRNKETCICMYMCVYIYIYIHIYCNTYVIDMISACVSLWWRNTKKKNYVCMYVLILDIYT